MKNTSNHSGASSPEAHPSWHAAMTKLVSHFFKRSDAEPFRKPVSWEKMGLLDYPRIVTKPMDLGTVLRKLEQQPQERSENADGDEQTGDTAKESSYRSVHDVADDVRLIWANCSRYNKDGSQFQKLAAKLAKKFEDKFAKLLRELDEPGGKYDGNTGGASGIATKEAAVAAKEPTPEERRSFVKSLMRMSPIDIGRVLIEIDRRCPAALIKDRERDHVDLTPDQISASVFWDISEYTKKHLVPSDSNAPPKKKMKK